jgi:hypothetical protein
MYQRVPNKPTSSPVVAAKMMVRLGRGPAARTRAISSTAMVPEASSSAPLKTESPSTAVVVPR